MHKGCTCLVTVVWVCKVLTLVDNIAEIFYYNGANVLG